jgi:hypothetical protein
MIDVTPLLLWPARDVLELMPLWSQKRMRQDRPRPYSPRFASGVACSRTSSTSVPLTHPLGQG